MEEVNKEADVVELYLEKEILRSAFTELLQNYGKLLIENATYKIVGKGGISNGLESNEVSGDESHSDSDQ